jgi:MSHA pilin protein MshD
MSRAERGVSLVELIIFIVVVGVAVVGVLAAINLGTRSSADPMVQKQALAIAEALLEEVQLQPFTYCDPDDAAAAGATGAALCTGGPGGANDENRIDPPAGPFPGGLGPEPGPPIEARGSTTFPLDNVGDYNGFSMSPITGIDGTAIGGLAAYSASVTVVNQPLGAIPASDAVLIRVTVDGPPGTDIRVVLDGYRVRYAPNALP